MFPDILTSAQQELLPLIRQFRKEYYLVGGTAIALQIGHRKSVDFDLFKPTRINKNKIKRELNAFSLEVERVLFEDRDQLHVVINGVKVTFFEYPYRIPHPVKWDNTISMPTLLDLASMKSYAMGRRSKWKDYVDLYFLLQEKFGYHQIVERSKELFASEFNEKLFREQLSYFADVDYSEDVEFCRNPVAKEQIHAFFMNLATNLF